MKASRKLINLVELKKLPHPRGENGLFVDDLEKRSCKLLVKLRIDLIWRVKRRGGLTAFVEWANFVE